MGVTGPPQREDAHGPVVMSPAKAGAVQMTAAPAPSGRIRRLDKARDPATAVRSSADAQGDSSSLTGRAASQRGKLEAGAAKRHRIGKTKP